MNPNTLTQLVRQGLRQNDPVYFGRISDAEKRETRAHAMSIILGVAGATCQALPEASTVAVLWKMRSALAPLAQTLRRAMNGLWEHQAGPSDIEQSIQDRVLELAFQQLDKAAGRKADPELRSIATVVVSKQAAGLPAGFDVVILGRVVRVELSKVGLFLQRASACLWTMAMQRAKAPVERSSSAVKAAVTMPTERTATTADAEAYRSALKEFAKKVASLKVNPATLPVGEEAVDEAVVLCAVLYFVQRRYRELRRWVHPQAAVDGIWTPYAEYGADRGEQLILSYNDHNSACADATDPRAWTWQDQEKAEYIVGDLLTSLHQAADALGIDWDAAEGSGAWHYEEESEPENYERTAEKAQAVEKFPADRTVGNDSVW